MTFVSLCLMSHGVTSHNHRGNDDDWFTPGLVVINFPPDVQERADD